MANQDSEKVFVPGAKCETCNRPPVSDIVDGKKLCADCIAALGTGNND